MNKGNGWKLKEGIELHPHQVVTFKNYLHNPRATDFSECGTGKSLPAICSVLEKISKGAVCKIGDTKYTLGENRNALILCPPTARIGWMLDTWSLFESTCADLVEYSGPYEKRCRIRAEVAASKRPVILIASWGLIQDKCGEDVTWLKTMLKPSYVIIDEAQYISGYSADRTLFFTNMIQFPYIENDYIQLLFLTATPVSNGPEKAWPYINLLYENPVTRKNDAYPRGMADFYDEHFDTSVDKYGREHVLNFLNREKFKETLNRRGVLHTRDEVFKNRKEPVAMTQTFEMDAEQSAMYWYFVENLTLELQNGDIIEAVDALQRMNKERQIASDPSITDLPSKDTKIKALKDILKEFGIQPAKKMNKFEISNDKVVILTEYRHSWAKVKEELEKANYRVTGVQGGMSPKQRMAALDRFNTDPTCNVFIGNRAAMAEGVNLQAAHILINYEIGWAANKFEQGLGRIDRITQLKRCIYITLLAEDTIDFYVWKKLNNRLLVASDIVEELIARTTKRTRKTKRLSKELKAKLQEMVAQELEKLQEEVASV